MKSFKYFLIEATRVHSLIRSFRLLIKLESRNPTRIFSIVSFKTVKWKWCQFSVFWILKICIYMFRATLWTCMTKEGSWKRTVSRCICRYQIAFQNPKRVQQKNGCEEISNKVCLAFHSTFVSLSLSRHLSILRSI